MNKINQLTTLTTLTNATKSLMMIVIKEKQNNKNIIKRRV